VGGDGTLHEVINGLLNRKDKQKIPIGFIPNGTGNDLVACFGVKTAQEALKFVLKGDVIKMDVNKVLIDADDESQILPEEKFDRTRFSVSSTAIGFIGRLTNQAGRFKPVFGKSCYIASGLHLLITAGVEVDAYSVEMKQPQDVGETVHIPNYRSAIVFINNSKFSGTGLNFTPCAFLNDGLLDIVSYDPDASNIQLLKGAS
jgi:diacylglycerol kinase family enzyme